MRGAFARSARVTSARSLSPHVREITFEGRDVQGVAWSPGDKVKLVLGGRPRSYTPSRWDAERGLFSVVFHLHGHGPAARWASGAQRGDEVGVLGPGRSMRLGPRADWAWFFGDETALGLAQALFEALPEGVQTGGVVELHPDDLESNELLSLPTRPVARHGAHGEALLKAVKAMPLPTGQGVVWLSGHAASVVALRKHFLEAGVPPERLLFKPYWSDRGHAHRKQLERLLAIQAA